MSEPILYETYEKGDLVELFSSSLVILDHTKQHYGIVVKPDSNHKNYYRIKVFGIHREIFAGADQMKRIT